MYASVWILFLSLPGVESAAGPKAEKPPLAHTAHPNPLREGVSSLERLATATQQRLESWRREVQPTDLGRALLAIRRLREDPEVGPRVLGEVLTSDDCPMELRHAALRSLEALGERAVPELCRLLGEAPEGGQYQIWLVLQELGPRAAHAVDHLAVIAADSHRDLEERLQAVQCLGSIGPAASRAASPLLNLALKAGKTDEDTLDLQRDALAALRALGPLSATDQAALLRFVQDEQQPHALRLLAAGCLANQTAPPPAILPIAAQGLREPDAERVLVALEITRQFGAQASELIPLVVGLLKHESAEVRASAVATCRHLGAAASAAVPELLQLASDSDEPDLSPLAAQAAAAVSPRAVERLSADLQAPDADLRWAALRGLAAWGPLTEPAVESLINTLRLRPTGVAFPELEQAFAMQTLARQGPAAAAAAPLLRERLADPHLVPGLRAAAARALGAVDTEAGEFLLAATRDRDVEVRIGAAAGLARLQHSQRIAIPLLLEELTAGDEGAEELASDALVEIGDPAIPALCELARDRQANLTHRQRACRLLARLEHGLVPLVQLLRTADDDLRAEVKTCLLVENPRGCLEVLLSAAESERTSDEQPQLREDLAELIVDLSGGQGGPLTAAPPPGSAPPPLVGAAPAPGAPAAAPTPPIAPAAPSDSAPRASAPPPPRATASVPAEEAAAETAPVDGARPLLREAEPPAESQLVRVYYGTNRAIESVAQATRTWAANLAWPALAAGAVTVAIVAVGLARARAFGYAAVAMVGLVLTGVLAELEFRASPAAAPPPAVRPGPVYSGHSEDRLEWGFCEVTIPPNHQRGMVERPSLWKLEFTEDPQQHVVLQRVEACTAGAFQTALRRDLETRGDSLLVFVHGYNVAFDEAARRTAQLAVDLEFPGVPLFFSWPSQANWYAYREDERQVELAVPYLQEFLQGLAEKSGARTIHLVAHSMGSRVLTSALREFSLQAERSAIHFNQVVLAAPDIDAEVFERRIAPAIAATADRLTLYASSHDLALVASRTFNSGQPRAGDSSRGLLVLPNVETIDASAVDSSLLGHSYYGDNPTLLSDLRDLLATNQPADSRSGLTAVVRQRQRYWILDPSPLAAVSVPATRR